jgi:hypothetical protein
MPEVKNRIYQELINATIPYLGPSSDRFISRQIRSHLKKEPEQVTSDDIRKLLDWIKLSMHLITDDSRLIDEYIYKLRVLAGKGRAKTKK